MISSFPFPFPQTDMDQSYNKHTSGRQLPTCQNETPGYLMCCRDSAAQNRMNHVCPLKLNQIQYSLSRAIHHSKGQRDCRTVQYTSRVLKRVFSLCNSGWAGRLECNGHSNKRACSHHLTKPERNQTDIYKPPKKLERDFGQDKREWL